MASNQMTVAALGRPFTLGMLYDARKDELHTGFTLWDKKTLQENRSEHAQRSSSFEITASDSIESKSSLLDIDASLKASFLSGLIQVEGSAKYLNDQKKSKNQSRVTLQYKATTTFEQLSMTHQEARNMLNTDIMDKQSATHVVTGILYGAHAFFVFDSQKLDSSSAQDIQGSMQAVIKKIPTFDVEGRVSIKLTDNEKALTDQFSCKFYGDFILQSNPATFEDAVKTYTQLPNLLEQKQDNAVPLIVWLTPLKKFDSTVLELKGEICIGLVRKAEKAVEDVVQAEMRCSDSMGENMVEKVPQIYKKLRNFHKLCQDYKSKLQMSMEKKFPLIRAGEEDDVSLEKLFDDREKSPFSEDNLNNWMNKRETEITAIRSCVEIMKETKPKMVTNLSELNSKILAPGVDHALCFVFTSVERDDPYLENMTKYLYSHEPQSDENVTTEDQWYISEGVHIRDKAKAFRDFTSTLRNSSSFTFLIAFIPNTKYKGATIYHYKDGILITDDFSQPRIPEVMNDRRDLIWYASDLNLDSRTASNWLTLSEDNKMATCGPLQKYPDLPERFDPRPQVLCTKGLTGRHYWEVEWSKGYKNDVGVGVTFIRIERKKEDKDSGLGSNEISWYFGEKQEYLYAWHNGQVWSGPVPPAGCNKVGVYLDWRAGTLSFYSVNSNKVELLYTFINANFTEAVYPGFYIYHFSNYASLCQM
ncbi:neoverrucotoxin subunit alpha-like [Triplophysa dalaica]|uniref:neoverrucotoxin subunit alpha-like n=1 Tax=Triplophysa dalaica TaxID=1582913 RepID=UPI0024DF804D|nr:neoverrucotoxin subunit alpha-like [Triplophysa dalaica]